MHIVLAFTYTHDRLLQPIPDKPCAAELFHHYQGSALFNYRLREDATPSERDAIVSYKLFIPLHLTRKLMGRV